MVLKEIQRESGGNALNKIVFLLLVTFLNQGLSQEPGKLEAKLEVVGEQDILNRGESLSQLTYGQYILELDKINELAKKYIDTRNEECTGSFSEVSINEKGEQVVKKKKLNRKERNSCLYTVISFRIKLVKVIYKARRQHLKNLQLIQNSELDKSEDLKVRSLEKLASKYKK